ncbi:MAG: DUF5106 domain-containing protein [Bacteroidales bacterium]|jgi:hypothetical protein|nr:DUF5106 domain-containing protein [Bacteroidales bacterium]
MNIHRFLKIAPFLVFLYGNVCLYAFRIEVSLDSLPARTPVFLAGYYGERVLVIDSTRTDTSGMAVFSGTSLPQGIYTLFVPGSFRYEFLLADEQTISISRKGVSGGGQTEAFAALASANFDKSQAKAHHELLMKQYSGSFLASYLAALQPVQPPDGLSTDEPTQMLSRYRYIRRHFFDHFDLSDANLLHTPLYAETIKYYFSNFVTQQTDTLIIAAYSLLQKASGNCETFFFVMDFLVDYSLRNDIKNIERLHRFLQPNRCMLSEKAVRLLPERSRKMGFTLPDEATINAKIKGMQVFCTPSQTFDFSQVNTQFCVFYFWDGNCPRCLSDAASWQKVMSKHRSKSCTGIAVNVQKQAPAGIPFDNNVINLNTSGISEYERAFLTNGYAKIVVTDANRNIIGVFGALQALDTFLSQMK